MSKPKKYKTHLENENLEMSRTSRWRKNKGKNITNESHAVQIAEPECIEVEHSLDATTLEEQMCHHDDERVEEDSDEEWDDNWRQFIYKEYNADDIDEEYELAEDSEESIQENTKTAKLYEKLEEESFFQTVGTSVNVSQAEIVMMVVKYALRFSLSHVAVTNMFSMINSMFSKPFLPDTRYLVDQMFFSRDIANLHSVCTKCGSYLGTYKYTDCKKKCNICGELINLKDKNYTNFFVTYNISEEIKNLIEANDEYYDEVVSRRVHQPGIYSDMYDGKGYRKFVKSLDPSERNSYCTITFNSDGAPVFESSTYSIWPIQMVINETPLHIRSSKTVLFGLWFGKNKPDMCVFLNSFVEEINKLTEIGISCTVVGNNRIIKPYVVCCCVDTIARAPMQGFIQFNGKYGCNWCLHSGVWVRNICGTGGTLRYPLLKDVPPERTLENSLNFMSDAVDTGTSVFGVTRVSPLINLNQFDIINGFVPDDMHFIRLGIAKQFLNYFIDRSSSPLQSVFSETELDVIDSLLNAFQVPNQVMRLSRPIRDRKFWKAKEWENWLLFYSVPILSILIEKKFLRHWIFFVEVFHISQKPIITRSDLENMYDLASKFLSSCEELYTNQVFTYNLHQLLHWIKSISDWGPSWAHSGFVFESGNGRILKNINCARGLCNQISRSVAMERGNKVLSEKVLPISSKRVQTFCKNLEEKNTKKTYKLFDIRYFGKEVSVQNVWKEKLQLSPESVYFKRMIKDRCLYSSKKLKRNRSNNTYALLKNGKFVQIDQFIVDKSQAKEFTIVSELKTENAFPRQLDVLQIVKENSNLLTAVDTNEISQICVYMEVQEKNYICPVPNLFYI